MSYTTDATRANNATKANHDNYVSNLTNAAENYQAQFPASGDTLARCVPADERATRGQLWK
jgi:hypothetical protein